MFFGYTGEYTGDSTQLVYLRARYYAPEMGRFLTRDTWSGIANSPVTLNPWLYANSNPIMYIDPSGRYSVPKPQFMMFYRTLLRTAGGMIRNIGVCNGLPDWLNYIGGASNQYLDILTISGWSHFVGNLNYVSNPAFQQGRNFGQSIALTQSMIETTIGLTTLQIASASIPPTLGGGAICEAASGGTCTLILAPTLAGEAGLAIAGAALATHGGAMLVYSANAGGGGGKTYRTLNNAERELQTWRVEENLKNSDYRHLDAAKRELAGETVFPGKQHIQEIKDAKRGLLTALDRINGALQSRSWNPDAVRYLLTQREIITNRIIQIEIVLAGG